MDVKQLGAGESAQTQPMPHSRGEFEVIVIFTHPGPTLTALKAAGRLARTLGARIRLIVPRWCLTKKTGTVISSETFL